jgi:D-beta-D-heptose 7-phosphate kinase/D-beta-D-heptose 1-phosphate adenosyltransferase
MHPFDQKLAEISQATVLCIGDLMLDDFVYGDVSRISPEAPTPVLAVTRESKVIGGAGNVARGIAALGAHCIFIGVMGEDEAGRMLARAFVEDWPGVETHIMVDSSRPTTRKVRFVSDHHSTHLLRADWEVAKPLPAEIERSLINAATSVLPRAQAVVLSDYAKGVLSPRVIRAVIDAAKAAGKPVIVDPKGADFGVYSGASVITPNRGELAVATHRTLAGEKDIEAAARQLGDRIGGEAVLVTRSEDGMTLVVRNNEEALHLPAYPVKVRDVSGAGDTVAAVLSVMLAIEAGFEPAVRAANAAAAVVVGKRGTATVSVAELRSRLLPAASLASEEKIVSDLMALDDHLADWRRLGLRIGFTNGCFDLIHPGHVKLLTEARSACDRLVVGLNSDASVTRLKGEGRPVQHQQGRAEVLAALEAVDLVVIFEEDTPLEVLRHVRPAVLVKGADYRVDEVVGRDLVEADGGHVVLVPIAAGYSTTKLVDRRPAKV